MSVEIVKLSTPQNEFFINFYKKQGSTTVVFIPGLMEPKAGLCYLGQEIALSFHAFNASVLLFDLAGQGDSTLPCSFNLWTQQLETICSFLQGHRIIFIARGLGAYLPFAMSEKVPTAFEVVALSPPSLTRITAAFPLLQMTRSVLTDSCITVLDPGRLGAEEKYFWYSLGAEVECLGCIEIPNDFFQQFQSVILSRKIDRSSFHRVYDAIGGNYPETFDLKNQNVHPLFNKKIERESLIKDIINYVF